MDMRGDYNQEFVVLLLFVNIYRGKMNLPAASSQVS